MICASPLTPRAGKKFSDRVSSTYIRRENRGIARNDQQVMGIILEIRRFEEGEIEREKEIFFEPPQKEHWANLYFSIEISVPEVVLASAKGVEIGFSSVMVQPLLCMEFFGIRGDEVFRPYSVWLYFGPFVDVRLSSILHEEYDHLYQVLPAGLTFSAGFSGYYPRIQGNRLTGRCFGVGGELQVRTNVLALIAGGDEEAGPMLAGEYVMDITPALVLHMLPNGFPPLDMTVGFPLKIFSNESTGSWELYSLGLSLGVRIRFTLKEFYRKES